MPFVRCLSLVVLNLRYHASTCPLSYQPITARHGGVKPRGRLSFLLNSLLAIFRLSGSAVFFVIDNLVRSVPSCQSEIVGKCRL